MALNEKDSLLGPSYSPCVSAGLNDRGDDPRFLHTTALESYDGGDSSPGGGCPTGDEFNPELGKAELALFFVLGLAPVFVWNCVFVSVAYFQTVLGKAVLSRLGLCQNGASLAVQLLLLLLRKQVRVFAAPVSGCFIYMAVMAVALLALPLDTLHPWMLYIGLTLNGMATGIAQTQLGCVAGLYGKAGRCGALLFSGNALGALLPPLLQLCMAVGIQAAGGGSGTDALRHEAIAIFAIGASGALFGLFCIIALSRTRNYRTLTAPTSMNSNCDCATIGSRVDLARRPAAEWTVKVSQLLLVITRATWLFALAIAPYVTPHDTTSPFWMRYLATVLIGATNVGDLIGRLAATASPPAYILQSLPLLIGGSAVRAVVTTAVVTCYVALPSDFAAAAVGTGNGFIILVYVLMSLTHGYLVVALQTKSQALCGFLPGVDSCPVVAQISWLSSQIGLVVGIGASFIPLAAEQQPKPRVRPVPAAVIDGELNADHLAATRRAVRALAIDSDLSMATPSVRGFREQALHPTHSIDVAVESGGGTSYTLANQLFTNVFLKLTNIRAPLRSLTIRNVSVVNGTVEIAAPALLRDIEIVIENVTVSLLPGAYTDLGPVDLVLVTAALGSNCRLAVQDTVLTAVDVSIERPGSTSTLRGFAVIGTVQQLVSIRFVNVEVNLKSTVRHMFGVFFSKNIQDTPDVLFDSVAVSAIDSQEVVSCLRVLHLLRVDRSVFTNLTCRIDASTLAVGSAFSAFGLLIIDASDATQLTVERSVLNLTQGVVAGRTGAPDTVFGVVILALTRVAHTVIQDLDINVDAVALSIFSVNVAEVVGQVRDYSFSQRVLALRSAGAAALATLCDEPRGALSRIDAARLSGSTSGIGGTVVQLFFQDVKTIDILCIRDVQGSLALTSTLDSALSVGAAVAPDDVSLVSASNVTLRGSSRKTVAAYLSKAISVTAALCDIETVAGGLQVTAFRIQRSITSSYIFLENLRVVSYAPFAIAVDVLQSVFSGGSQIVIGNVSTTPHIRTDAPPGLRFTDPGSPADRVDECMMVKALDVTLEATCCPSGDPTGGTEPTAPPPVSKRTTLHLSGVVIHQTFVLATGAPTPLRLTMPLLIGTKALAAGASERCLCPLRAVLDNSTVRLRLPECTDAGAVTVQLSKHALPAGSTVAMKRTVLDVECAGAAAPVLVIASGGPTFFATVEVVDSSMFLFTPPAATFGPPVDGQGHQAITFEGIATKSCLVEIVNVTVNITGHSTSFGVSITPYALGITVRIVDSRMLLAYPLLPATTFYPDGTGDHNWVGAWAVMVNLISYGDVELEVVDTAIDVYVPSGRGGGVLAIQRDMSIAQPSSGADVLMAIRVSGCVFRAVSWQATTALNVIVPPLPADDVTVRVIVNITRTVVNATSVASWWLPDPHSTGGSDRAASVALSMNVTTLRDSLIILNRSSLLAMSTAAPTAAKFAIDVSDGSSVVLDATAFESDLFTTYSSALKSLLPVGVVPGSFLSDPRPLFGGAGGAGSTPAQQPPHDQVRAVSALQIHERQSRRSLSPLTGADNVPMHQSFAIGVELVRVSGTGGVVLNSTIIFAQNLAGVTAALLFETVRGPTNPTDRQLMIVLTDTRLTADGFGSVFGMAVVLEALNCGFMIDDSLVAATSDGGGAVGLRLEPDPVIATTGGDGPGQITNVTVTIVRTSVVALTGLSAPTPRSSVDQYRACGIGLGNSTSTRFDVYGSQFFAFIPRLAWDGGSRPTSMWPRAAALFGFRQHVWTNVSVVMMRCEFGATGIIGGATSVVSLPHRIDAFTLIVGNRSLTDGAALLGYKETTGGVSFKTEPHAPRIASVTPPSVVDPPTSSDLRVGPGTDLRLGCGDNRMRLGGGYYTTDPRGALGVPSLQRFLFQCPVTDSVSLTPTRPRTRTLSSTLPVPPKPLSAKVSAAAASAATVSGVVGTMVSATGAAGTGAVAGRITMLSALASCRTRAAEAAENAAAGADDGEEPWAEKPPVVNSPTQVQLGPEPSVAYALGAAVMNVVIVVACLALPWLAGLAFVARRRQQWLQPRTKPPAISDLKTKSDDFNRGLLVPESATRSKKLQRIEKRRMMRQRHALRSAAEPWGSWCKRTARAALTFARLPSFLLLPGLLLLQPSVAAAVVVAAHGQGLWVRAAGWAMLVVIMAMCAAWVAVTVSPHPDIQYTEAVDREAPHATATETDPATTDSTADPTAKSNEPPAGKSRIMRIAMWVWGSTGHWTPVAAHTPPPTRPATDAAVAEKEAPPRVILKDGVLVFEEPSASKKAPPPAAMTSAERRRRRHNGEVFLRRFALFVTDYRGAVAWFGAVEVALGVLTGVFEGLAFTTGCAEVAWATVAAQLLYAVAIFSTRPFAVRFELGFAATESVVLFSGALLTALLASGVFEAEDSEGNDSRFSVVLELVLLVAAFIVFARAGLDLLRLGAGIVVLRGQRATDNVASLALRVLRGLTGGTARRSIARDIQTPPTANNGNDEEIQSDTSSSEATVDSAASSRSSTDTDTMEMIDMTQLERMNKDSGADVNGEMVQDDPFVALLQRWSDDAVAVRRAAEAQRWAALTAQRCEERRQRRAARRAPRRLPPVAPETPSKKLITRMGCAVSVSVASDEATTTVPTPAPVETPGAPTPPTGSGSGEFRWSPTCGDYGGTYEYHEEDARHDAMVAQWVLEQQALHRHIVPVHTTPAPRSQW